MIKRKELRINGYNYSNEGAYFITICIKDRQCILSKIIQEKDTPKVILLNYGKIVENYIKSINKIYNDIKIYDYIIMPNHIHFICTITNIGSSRTPTPTNAKIPFIVSTLKRLTNKDFKKKIWQRNYYEHVIRNEKEFLEILTYIQNNPYNWNKDRYFT